jgi:hypothetical protein
LASFGSREKSIGRRKRLPHKDGSPSAARWDRRFRLSIRHWARFSPRRNRMKRVDYKRSLRNWLRLVIFISGLESLAPGRTVCAVYSVDVVANCVSIGKLISRRGSPGATLQPGSQGLYALAAGPPNRGTRRRGRGAAGFPRGRAGPRESGGGHSHYVPAGTAHADRAAKK